MLLFKIFKFMDTVCCILKFFYRIVSKTRSSYIKFGINYFRLILKVIWFLWRYKTIYLSNFSSYIRGRLVIKVVLFWRLYGRVKVTYQTSFFDNFVTLFHDVLSQNSLITKSRSEKIMRKKDKPMYEEHLHLLRRGLNVMWDELGMMLMPQLSYVTRIIFNRSSRVHPPFGRGALV